MQPNHPKFYSKAAVIDGWVMLATNVKKGERVRLIGSNKEGIHEVLEVAPGRFRTAFAADAEAVFVYGREVKDFRSVDYEAIAMLNVSATQELNRRLETQAAEFAAQTAEFGKQAAAMIRQAARIAELEQGREIELAVSTKQAERIAGLEKQASDVAMLKQQMAELLAAAPPGPRLAATK